MSIIQIQGWCTSATGETKMKEVEPSLTQVHWGVKALRQSLDSFIYDETDPYIPNTEMSKSYSHTRYFFPFCFAFNSLQLTYTCVLVLPLFATVDFKISKTTLMKKTIKRRLQWGESLLVVSLHSHRKHLPSEHRIIRPMIRKTKMTLEQWRKMNLIVP